MTTEFCCSNKLVSYILCKVECDPEYAFAEAELKEVCPKTFKVLKDNKFLEWRKFDLSDTFFSRVPGDQDTPRYLKAKKNGKYDAYPSDDSSFGCIEVEEKDIPQWHCALSILIEEIRKNNNLEEQVDPVDSQLFFVGSTETTNGRVSVYLGLFDSPKDLESGVRGLPGRVSTYAQYVVITPSSRIEKQNVLKDLEKIKVRQVLLKEAFQGTGFKFKPATLASGVSEKQPFSLKLTGIVNGKGRSRKHLIKIAGKDGELTDALFVILLRFVEGVMKTKSGQVAVSSLTGEGVVHEEGYKQYIGRLRERLNALFPDFNFHELIENREGSYRLAVPKDSIDYDLPMLKKLMDNGKIGNIVKRLPSLRRKKA